MANIIRIKSIVNESAGEEDYKKLEDGKQTKVAPVTSVQKFPLTAPITVEALSEFTKWSDMVPQLDSLINIVTTLGAGVGSLSEGTLNLQNMTDVPRWSKTNPIRIITTLHFYVEDDPPNDVYWNMYKLIRLTLPERDQKNPKRLILPGVSLGLMHQSKASQQKNEDAIAEGGKFVSVDIPGVIFLPLAMVTRAMPTYSNETTTSGFPLWGTLEIEIISLYPALADHFLHTYKLGTVAKASFNEVLGPTGDGGAGAGGAG